MPLKLDGNVIAVIGAVTVLACAQPQVRDSNAAVAATAGALRLDGSFDDWRGVAPAYIDTARTGALIREVWTHGDARWWHLSLATTDSINLQAMQEPLLLLIDADESGRTGHTVYEMSGVDYAVEFSRRDTSNEDERGAGFALRTVARDGLGSIRSPYDVELAALPSWRTDRVEIRIARHGAPDGFGRLGRAVRFRLMYGNTASASPVSPVLRHEFRAAAAPRPIAPVHALPTKGSGALRVAQWNVSEGSFRRPVNHARLLAAVEPDVVLLDEVYQQITDSALTAFFASPPLAALGTWRFVVARSGGRQRTVVAARNRALRAADSLRFVAYTDGALDSLRGRVPGAAQRLIDIEAAAQVSATGAWVEVGTTPVLFVSLDLQSAGFAGSVHDELRVLQARAIRARIDAERRTVTPDAPVVIGGDFNAVGSYRSVSILQDGLDTDGSSLTLSNAARLTDGSLLTWRNRAAAQFAPGRLDLTLYPDAAFRQTGGFVFASDDLDGALLSRLGVSSDLSERTADHLIVVTDLVRR